MRSPTPRLDTVRALVAEPSARRDVLRQQAERLRDRIAAAQDALAPVECALGCEYPDVTRCAHVRRPPGATVAASGQ